MRLPLKRLLQLRRTLRLNCRRVPNTEKSTQRAMLFGCFFLSTHKNRRKQPLFCGHVRKTHKETSNGRNGEKTAFSGLTEGDFCVRIKKTSVKREAGENETDLAEV